MEYIIFPPYYLPVGVRFYIIFLFSVSTYSRWISRQTITVVLYSSCFSSFLFLFCFVFLHSGFHCAKLSDKTSITHTHTYIHTYSETIGQFLCVKRDEESHASQISFSNTGFSIVLATQPYNWYPTFM